VSQRVGISVLGTGVALLGTGIARLARDRAHDSAR
jgi:hypothetical protein